MENMEQKVMTVREVVEGVIDELGKINIPVTMMESIGFPIARSIANLKQVCAAWDNEPEQTGVGDGNA